jgi:DeoR/GlpR family transcriptional regulator of sugar metabolism
VVDHTKWDVRGLSRMAHLSEAHVLISDAGLGTDAQSVLTEHVGRLIVAPTGR